MRPVPGEMSLRRTDGDAVEKVWGLPMIFYGTCLATFPLRMEEAQFLTIVYVLNIFHI